MAGCSGNKTTNPPPVNTPPARLVADTTVTAPSMTNVNDPIWNQVDSVRIRIGALPGFPTFYDGAIDTAVVLKAIKKNGNLFLLARWGDGAANLWGNYIIKEDSGLGYGSYNFAWNQNEFEGEDKIAFLFDAGDNGTQRADCAAMCHVDSMSASTGHADVWEWKSSTTFPTKLADDLWMTTAGLFADTRVVNTYSYRNNWGGSTTLAPNAMNKDSSSFTGPFLYIPDTTEMDYGTPSHPIRWWPIGYKMPGWILDTTIYYSPTRTNSSIYDVVTIAKHDSVNTPHTWTVVFERALNTTHADDVDMSALDSIQVSLMAASNHSVALDPAHSGSKPFYIILK